MGRVLTALLLFLTVSGASRAEYRVALAIGGDEIEPAVKMLEDYGFVCTKSEPLSEKELRRLIEGWIPSSPTNSTALIYFSGSVTEGEFSGKPSVGLMAANDRPVPLAQVVEILEKRGGSSNHIVVANSPTNPEVPDELPEGYQFVYADLGTNASKLASAGDLASGLSAVAASGGVSSLPDGFEITGMGSVAIAPPDKFGPGKKAGDEWVNSRGMIFCWCPPGKYIAGSPEGTPGRYDDEQQREVVIEEGFWIAKYELTRSQSLRNISNNSIGSHKNHPVEKLHWDDGRPMASRTLTEEERKAGRLPSGWEYDVPTEEQWEYAARAGTTTRYYFGDDMNLLTRHANFADKSFYESGDIYSNAAHRTLDDGTVRLAVVGSYEANPWGLHDVYGNVAEWCRNQAARGGSWVSVPENCRSAYRDHYSSRNDQIYLGYRFVIQPNQPDPKKK